MNLIQELQWRGLVQDMIPGTEEQFQKEITSAYIGFDPTSDSLHIGSLVQIILLMHVQRAGHKPYALVGGATGMVGDPSGKSEERNMLPVEQIVKNCDGIRNQLMKFLDFDSSSSNAAILVNNIDWFEKMTFLHFIRDIGKFITVNYMMAKDSVQKRLESGMSFTEFTYQLVQGYDFYHLYSEKSVKVQMGGSDQWGNIVTGTELIRKKNGGEAFAFTSPLIKKADGGKFGKTESGNIWLDRSKTAPYQFYQFWLNTSDADAETYIRIFTFLSKEEIDQLISEHQAQPHLRSLQKKLAQEVTIMVHSEEDYLAAVESSQLLFRDDAAEVIKTLSEETLLDLTSGVPRFAVTRTAIQTGITLVNLLAESGALASKTEARKMIQNGAIQINKQKMMEVDTMINEQHLLVGHYILIQKGKKDNYLIVCEN